MNPMNKYSVLPCIVIAIGVCLLGDVAGTKSDKTPDKAALDFRILIQHENVFGKLTRPPVEFKHDFHVDILKKEGCGECHHVFDKQQNKLVYKQGLEESCDNCHEKKDVLNQPSLMNAFHNQCVECHKTYNAAKKDSGPITCGNCHVKKSAYTGFKPPMEFDHAQHLKVMEVEPNCGNCHHEYVDGRLVYVKGKETYCSKCHKDVDEDNARSLRKVYHADCIWCHRENVDKELENPGPVTCYGCHGQTIQPTTATPLPRYIRTFQAEPTKLMLWHPGAKMPAVPYDHKVHLEKMNDKCEGCHQFHSRAVAHMSPDFLEISQACVNCHTAAKLKSEAGNMDLDRVYHDEKAESSCIGCHIKMDKGPKYKEQCYECHKGEVDLARMTSQQGVLPTDIPEEIVIDRLVSKYPPIKFPHTYHAKLIGNCRICHHHHEEEQIKNNHYQGCYVCHTSSFDFEFLNRPRLVGAYHRSCLGCHKDRGVGPITCEECHESQEEDLTAQTP